jgi:hypothetical protein
LFLKLPKAAEAAEAADAADAAEAGAAHKRKSKPGKDNDKAPRLYSSRPPQRATASGAVVWRAC